MAALSLYLLLTWIFLLSLFCTRFAEVLCHADESSALMEFKRSFRTNVTDQRCVNPKVHSWSLDGSGDCCSWDGVKCDEVTSRVIALDLSSSCLSGTMSPNTTLFQLAHVESLNLAFNSFKFSSIPYGFGNLSKLQYLNLSASDFSGEIPRDIWQLSKLVSLDLSSSTISLRMANMGGLANMGGFVHNLTGLKELDLSSVSLSSPFLPMLANFSSLTLLRLKYCRLSGNFPVSIFQLPNLEVLSVAGNSNLSMFFPKMHWGSANMGGFIHNLTGLKELDLSSVSLSSPFLPMLANFSSLTLLRLKYCRLSGNFPVSIFQLPNLEVLSVAGNSNLSVFFPKLHWGSPLKSLYLYWTNLLGEIPTSIGNLSLLNELLASGCYFSGLLPSSMGNLSHLTELDLSENNLQGQIPVSFANLTQLSILWLYNNNLSGDSLERVVNLTKLTVLDISGYLSELLWLDLSHNRIRGNQLSNGFPSSLIYLDLSGNDLHGDILGTLRNLKDLQGLYLSSLNLNGILDVNDLFTLKNLTTLYLSNSNISFTKSFINATTSKLTYLYLDSCNLTEFPRFIGYLSELSWLDLSHNRIQGIIPRWMWNNSKESLMYIDLSHNLLTSFLKNQTDLPSPNLNYLDISSNLLKTTLLVPPPSVMVYNISNNFLYGEVPTSICEVSSLTMLDLSNNSLNGTLPPCLGSIHPLISLNLARNKFNGMIPHIFLDDCALRMIDFRENRLSGIVPRSLGNCSLLEYLNLGDNQINDTFPFWLSKLAYLEVIGLRSNNFHGPIESSLSELNFTRLHILDISNNGFNGEFPSNLLKSCHAMKVMVGQDALEYLDVYKMDPNVLFSISIFYAMKLMSKGTEREYAKIPDVFMAVDLSNNEFEGFIPELIGDLKSLRMLNLSNNLFNGSIPPSLANLTVLESLDLSQNNLVGEIPQQLARLTFLSVFNVSHNRLSGPIPRATQFDTFGSSSFAMNDGLCGSPLPNKCTNGENAPPPPSYFKVDNEEECLFNLDWRIVLVGAGVGFLVGVVIENLIIDEKSMWFLCYSKKMAKGWKKVRKALADKKICS
ncbi:hypothetical protein EUGRSUZ_E01227 [Eucalyptus grandis]|uniref:Uncharacterized protein n=2 Tax=Eucalyptus grandis TaxID=71139 RepID=A0ACC3KUL8_EUCGR|nr:hypothetical protein EUGRSUZ_E01227 [Eucalyptus grandis]